MNSAGTLNDNSDIDEGWSMEIAIPVKAFNEVIQSAQITEGEEWAFLAVRQNRDKIYEEHRETISNFDIELNYKQGVHQSDKFGSMRFVK